MVTPGGALAGGATAAQRVRAPAAPEMVSPKYDSYLISLFYTILSLRPGAYRGASPEHWPLISATRHPPQRGMPVLQTPGIGSARPSGRMLALQMSPTVCRAANSIDSCVPKVAAYGSIVRGLNKFKFVETTPKTAASAVADPGMGAKGIFPKRENSGKFPSF